MTGVGGEGGGRGTEDPWRGRYMTRRMKMNTHTMDILHGVQGIISTPFTQGRNNELSQVRLKPTVYYLGPPEACCGRVQLHSTPLHSLKAVILRTNDGAASGLIETNNTLCSRQMVY